MCAPVLTYVVGTDEEQRVWLLPQLLLHGLGHQLEGILLCWEGVLGQCVRGVQVQRVHLRGGAAAGGGLVGG
jgi:hypothetical protein